MIKAGKRGLLTGTACLLGFSAAMVPAYAAADAERTIRNLPVCGSITWQQASMPHIAPGPEGGISGMCPVVHDGKIYVAGGFIPDGDGSGEPGDRTSKWLHEYDPGTGAWTALTDMPFRREYHRCIADGSTMYLLGGAAQHPDGYQPFATVVAADLGSNPVTWTSAGTLSEPITHMAVGKVGRYLVVAGGNHYDAAVGGYHESTVRVTVNVFDTEQPAAGWTTAASIPGAPRGWSAFAACNGKLYVLGGLTFAGNQFVGLAETLAYDPAENTWTELTPPPLPVSGWTAAVYLSRYLVIVGGVARPPAESAVAGRTATSEVFWNPHVIVYDTDQDRWMRMDGEIIGGRDYGGYVNDNGVVLDGDTLYVIGGEGTDGKHTEYLRYGKITFDGPPPPETVDIGSRRELFVDHLLIESMSNATHVLQTPTDEGVAFRFDLPWEGMASGYVTVIPDGGLYRLYYRGLPTENVDDSRTCYAESTNGIDWVRPNLGLHEVYGSTSNNVILTDAARRDSFAPFLDANPDAPPAERYKATASGTGNLAGYSSPDGIHWTNTYGTIMSGFEYDSLNVAFYSTAEGQYVCYFRDWVPNYSGTRRIRRAAGGSFAALTDGGLMDYRYYDGQSHPFEHHYVNGTHPYLRAPHQYIALAARFIDNSTESDALFMTARAGSLVYDRLFPDRYIDPADEIGPQAARSNFPAENSVRTGPAEMSFYVGHNYRSVSNHLRRYSLRLDGFVALSVTNGVGEVLTKPLTFEGQRLRLNYKARSNGNVRVEIRDINGSPVGGRALADAVPLTGDEIDGVVSWSGGNSVAPLSATPVVLRFVMENADLFAMRFDSVISNTAPVGVTRTGATLRGGLAAGPATVGVRWGPAQSATNGTWAEDVVIGSRPTGPLAFPVTNLTADTRYGYTFYVSNAQETIPAVPAELFSTAFEPSDAPSGLTAVADAAEMRIALTWQDNSDSQTGFRLERSENGSDWVLDGFAAANATGALSIKLKPATRYDYRVQAFSESDATAFSGIAGTETADVMPILTDGIPNPDFEIDGVKAMRLWLDADDDATVQLDGGVSRWADKSGNNHDALMQTPSRRPAYNASGGASGKGQITFDGTADYLAVNDPLPDDSSLTVFFALNRTGDTTHRGGLFQRNPDSPYNGFDLGQGSDTVWYAAAKDSNGDGASARTTTVVGPQLWAAVVDFNAAPGITGLRLYKNGSLAAAGSTNNVDNISYSGGATLALMARPRTFPKYQAGSVYEVLVYTSALSSNDHNAVGYYLQDKWGIGGAYEEPIDPDADGDGIPDAWEERYGGTNLFHGGSDYDGDGLDDDEEYDAGTVPTNDASVLRIEHFTGAATGSVVLAWQSVSGRLYSICSGETPHDPRLSTVTGNLPATPPINVHTTSADGRRQQFYRVKVTPTPPLH